IAQALDRDPTFDVARYARDQYGRDAYPFLILMADGKDGKVAYSNGGPFPEAILREARARLLRRPDTEHPEWGRYEGYGRGGRPGPPPGFRGLRPAQIVVQGQVEGVVAVLPRAGFPFLFSRYLPTLSIVAAGSLIVGALLAAFMIFGPARKRLREVEDAAR